MKDFIGVKIALLCGDKILTYQRDNKPGLRFAGLWDLPGGGREGIESPQQCISRELYEECQFVFDTELIEYLRYAPALHDDTLEGVFMVARLSQHDIDSMRFGEEGSKWHLVSINRFLADENGIKPLQQRLATYLNQK